jgi:hypothetical protein
MYINDAVWRPVAALTVLVVMATASCSRAAAPREQTTPGTVVGHSSNWTESVAVGRPVPALKVTRTTPVERPDYPLITHVHEGSRVARLWSTPDCRHDYVKVADDANRAAPADRLIRAPFPADSRRGSRAARARSPTARSRRTSTSLGSRCATPWCSEPTAKTRRDR